MAASTSDYLKLLRIASSSYAFNAIFAGLVAITSYCFQQISLQSHVLESLGISETPQNSLAVSVILILIFYASTGVMIWLLTFISSLISILFNKVPGPRLAKFNPFWKLYYVWKGTYTSKVRDLHREYGKVVQVGPYEYSVSGQFNPQPFNRSNWLEKIHPPYLSNLGVFHAEAFKLLAHALEMANIFKYELKIDACNQTLLDCLARYAKTGEQLDLPDLIARYSFDTLFATTVGEAPGFLSQQLAMSKFTNAMENWKFHAILYGSYLRFHPIISKVLHYFKYDNSFERQISKYLNINPKMDDLGGCALGQIRDAPRDTPPMLEHTREACIALILAGSDPMIKHILTTLFYIYQDLELIEKLRDEIDKSNLSQPPKIKELIHAAPQMPVLHAALNEALRLHQPRNSDHSYISPDGGVKIQGQHIPPESTICLEPSATHIDPNVFGSESEAFDPQRWLRDSKSACRLTNRMIAFGAGTSTCPGENLHYSLVSKIIIQVITNFDINMSTITTTPPTSPVKGTFNFGDLHFTCTVHVPKSMKSNFIFSASSLEFVPNQVAHGVKWMNGAENKIPAVTVDAKVSPTLSVASIDSSGSAVSTPISWTNEKNLEKILGRDATNALLKRFDPAGKLEPCQFIKTKALDSGRDRAILHETLDSVYGGKVAHVTDKAYCMYIWVPGSSLPSNVRTMLIGRWRNGPQPKKSNGGTAAPQVKPTAPPRQQVDAGWSNFAVNETGRYNGIKAMSGDEYLASKPKIADEATDKAANNKPAPPISTLKTTYVITGNKTTNGKLGGPRNILESGHQVHANGNTTETISSKVAESVTEKEVLPEQVKPKVIPPHLRKAAAKKAAEDAKAADWIAARLPNPRSSN